MKEEEQERKGKKDTERENLHTESGRGRTTKGRKK